MSTIDRPLGGAVLYAKDLRRVTDFYEHAIGLTLTENKDDHVVLERSDFQLVIVQIPIEIAAKIEISTPPDRRSDAAVKLVFYVSDIAAVREAAGSHGGALNAADHEWSFGDATLCDGLDPEGNVIQCRQRAKPKISGMRRFDTGALYEALNAQRASRNLTWEQVGYATGVSPSTLRGTQRGGRLEVDGMLAMVSWLGQPVEAFVRDDESGML